MTLGTDGNPLPTSLHLNLSASLIPPIQGCAFGTQFSLVQGDENQYVYKYLNVSREEVQGSGTAFFGGSSVAPIDYHFQWMFPSTTSTDQDWGGANISFEYAVGTTPVPHGTDPYSTNNCTTYQNLVFHQVTITEDIFDNVLN